MALLMRDHINYTVNGVHLGDIPNYNEVAVLEMMRKMAEEGKLPETTEQIEDIYALALNLLPSRYIQPTSFSTYKEQFAPSTIEIRAAILQATSRVLSNDR